MLELNPAVPLMELGSIMDTDITGMAPWYGAKRQLAARVVKACGPHRCYLEPFCGSMATLFAKPVATMEIVNDLHGDLINLARTIQDPEKGPILFERLQRTLVGPDIWQDSAAVIRDVPFEATIERAGHFFVYSWQGRNGSAGSNGGNNFCVRYTSEGGSPGTRFMHAVDSLPEWFKRMRAITILNMDAFELLARFEDRDGTVIYCDPPYIVKGAKYVHDFAKEYPHPKNKRRKISGHELLAFHLHRFKKTRVVVSYYEHPLLETLYPGWRKIEIEVTKNMDQMRRRDEKGKTIAMEVLLVNQNEQPELFTDF